VRDRDSDKIELLDAGADDYLVKPFSPGELLARLRVIFRHRQPTPVSAKFQTGRLMVDLSQRLVLVNNITVKLTTIQYAILRLFVQNAGKVLTHRQILREVWGPSYVDQTHYLRVYIAQLRRKLEDDPTAPDLILTEPGVGYRLAIED
jgi:two-component system KDP operon response regulator KdpE